MSAFQLIKERAFGRAARGSLVFVATLFAVELLDELVYGVQGAALPLIRDDLRLTYLQVGLLLSVPGYVTLVLDPLIGLLGDIWPRKALVAGGALVTAVANSLVAAARVFPAVLGGFILSSPASTAYVSLSQATLMDMAPAEEAGTRRPGSLWSEYVMARWAVLGSLGNLAGPLLVTAAVAAGLGWRSAYLLLAGLAGLAALVLSRARFTRAKHDAHADAGKRPALRELPGLVARSGVLRWLALMTVADLLLDVLFSFCALYFSDVVGTSAEVAGLAVAVLTLGGLAGDVLLIPLIEKIDGLRLVRYSAAAALVLYAGFLLVPGLWAKLALLALLGPARSGWWQVLEGRAYTALPGYSGTVVALNSLTGLLSASYPLLLGAVAERFGLTAAMALLAIAPVALLLGLPANRGGRAGRDGRAESRPDVRAA